MKSSDSVPAQPGPWTSLWVVALFSLLAQMWLCQFFTFGNSVPSSIDVNPSNLWTLAYHFPPTADFRVLNWLGQAYLPSPLNPLSLAAEKLSTWFFFTTYAPLVATCALLAMTAFLRELDLSRPAAIFGGVIYAWQGDLLPFVFPGHYAYITSWPFFALGAWAALRSERTKNWAYALISGASCGIMVGLSTNADRGAIASLLIAGLYIARFVTKLAKEDKDYMTAAQHLLLCIAVAALIALAPLLALFKNNIEDVKLAGTTDREQTYKLVTQFSLAPAETLTYLVPGFFGWHIDNFDGPYWGWIGEWPDWPKNHQGTRNLNLAISTTGTMATVLALLGVGLLLWDGVFGASRMTERQRFYGRFLLGLGSVALVLSWGWHTPFYRPLFALPLMDKWRNPLKWVELTNFALVVLSAMGVQHLLTSLEAETPDVKIIRSRLALFSLLVAILMGFGFVFSYPVGLVVTSVLRTETYDPALQQQGYDPSALANMMSTMHASTFVAFIEMLLFCVVLRLLWRPEMLRTWKPVNPILQRAWQKMLLPEYLPVTLAVALAVLAAVQLGWVTTHFIEPSPIEDLTATNPLLDALRGEGDTIRCSVVAQDPVLRDMLLNQFAAMNISCLDISAASRIPDDLNTFFQTLSNNQAQLWFLSGVKNVVVPEAGVEQMRHDAGVAANIDHAVGFTLVPTPSPEVPSHAMVTMKQYLAKATLVPDAIIFKSNDAMLDMLKDPKWNPRATVLLSPAHRLPPIALPPQSPEARDELGLVVYTPTAIEINVRSARGGFVLINDQYDPDWTAKVNGVDTEVMRADYIMRAVQVPAGDSTLTMKYAAHYDFAGFKPPVRLMNNLSDGAMLAAWLVAGIALLRRKPTENP